MVKENEIATHTTDHIILDIKTELTPPKDNLTDIISDLPLPLKPSTHHQTSIKITFHKKNQPISLNHVPNLIISTKS